MTGPAAVRVLVVAAMDREVRPLVRTLSLQRAFIGDQPAWMGLDVAAAVVGIGPAAAGLATRSLLAAAGGVGRVLMVGVAGAVDPSLSVGQLLAPAEVVDRASGARYRPDHPAGTAVAGVLATDHQLAAGPDAVSGLRAEGVWAVDMETAAVAGACEDAGVPWSVLRAVSDRLADGVVDGDVLGLTRPDGTTDLGAVAGYLLRRPWRVARLARLGMATDRAVRTVTRAAVPVCRPPGTVTA
ncbi:MAG TPA: hypothetical protein VHB02_13825 [Acidimicrobiales bacterium]|nr:hypothetical protein [Acidimicrobiales bacterium]